MMPCESKTSASIAHHFTNANEVKWRRKWKCSSSPKVLPLWFFFSLNSPFFFAIWFTFSCLFSYFIFYLPCLLLSRSIWSKPTLFFHLIFLTSTYVLGYCYLFGLKDYAWPLKPQVKPSQSPPGTDWSSCMTNTTGDWVHHEVEHKTPFATRGLWWQAYKETRMSSPFFIHKTNQHGFPLFWPSTRKSSPITLPSSLHRQAHTIFWSTQTLISPLQLHLYIHTPSSPSIESRKIRGNWGEQISP